MNRRSAVGRRRRKGGLLRKLCFALVLFLVGYVGFLVYYNFGKPYTVALDAGHGGADVGAEGVIQEVALTEQTVAELQTLLEEDGRFRVVLSRKAGEGATVTERNHKFRRRHPDLMLSVHGNASDSSSANGFECYPSPPGYENYEESLAFATCLAQEMQNIGANLRGTGIAGVRYGYYDENGNKLLCDSSDTTVYSYDILWDAQKYELPCGSGGAVLYYKSFRCGKLRHGGGLSARRPGVLQGYLQLLRTYKKRKSSLRAFFFTQ